jgi:hypothetical protein
LQGGQVAVGDHFKAWHERACTMCLCDRQQYMHQGSSILGSPLLANLLCVW